MMEDWKTKTLGEVTSFMAKGIPPKYVDHEGENIIRVLNQKCNRNYRISYNDSRLHDNSVKKVPDSKILRPGDVLINSTGTGTAGRIAQIWHIPVPTTIDGHMILLRPTDEIDPLYYGYVLKRNLTLIESYAEGSTGQTEINKNRLKEETIISFPSDINEQRKIARILAVLDEKIEENEKINKNLEEQMEALYKSWFIDFEPFGRIKPSDWQTQKIYSIANIIYGAPFSSKLFNTAGIGKPIIRIRDLKSQEFVTYTTEKHSKGHLIKPGDIVVGMDGEFRPYIWGNEEAWLNQRVCIFENKRPKGKAFLLFSIQPLLKMVEQTQIGTTVIHIGKKDFDTFEIVLPDAKTLNLFDEITTPMIEQIVNNSLEDKRLKVLRDTLLPKLMSGEIDVTTLDI
ncbi:restriction endonuclease subunit S [Megasphaera hominis]|uniref:Restriction endonuclease subunit S n=1 Tax=Megasphaera hominis TaxID=159836 RepID=A0ABR6VEY4_9FIRM|nr:restriction endonuclease subunit S [Megasphaera hominis]MBC3535706.1 restriction endonuclease subunit S [Megasphaera hominis]